MNLDKKHLFLLFLFACTNKEHEQVVVNNSQNTENATLESDTFGYMSYKNEYVRDNYLNNYLKIDTTIQCDNSQINIKLYQNCKFDSAILIPENYSWGTHRVFITHNMEYELVILKENKTLTKKIITRKSIIDSFDKSLKKFGVLLYPSIDFIDCVSRELEISFSYSIPITDVGNSVKKQYKF